MKKCIMLLVLLLVGCVPMQQRQQDDEMAAQRARADAMHADAQRVKNFCMDLFNDREIDPIRTKVGIIDDGESSFEMLTDSSKPTKTEKKALVVWAKKKEKCYSERISSMHRFSPPLAPEFITLNEAFFPRFQFLTADLHNELMTYGEFSRKRRELNTEYKIKREEIKQLLTQRSADAHYKAQHLANEARKAAAMEEQAANQRYLNYLRETEAMRPPQPFTCTTYYNMTTCQ